MRNLTLRFLLAAAVVLIVTIPFTARAQGDSKKTSDSPTGSAQTTTTQTTTSGPSCPMRRLATAATGDMMKNMPMGDMMKNMPMGEMMKNMPMGEMMKNMPMGEMMKNMPMGNQPSTTGTKKP